MRIMVYGSLRKGLTLASALRSATFLGNVRTLPLYTMISLGAFPGVLEGGETAIAGELYEIDAETLRRLDQIEGHPTHYERKDVRLDPSCGFGELVEAYIYPRRARFGDLQVVAGGDWVAYLRAVRGRHADERDEEETDDDAHTF